MSATVTVTVTDTSKVINTQPEQQLTEPNNNPTSTNDVKEQHITTQPILKLTRLSAELIQIEYITPTINTNTNTTNVYNHNWTHTFPNNAFLSDIISHFNTTSITPTPFPNHIKLNNQLFPLTTAITTLFPANTNHLTLTFSYLPELADSYHNSLTSSLQHISQLLIHNNTLLLLTFHRKTRTFTSKHFPSSSQTQLHLYSPSTSASCNAPNTLYISGGDSSLTHFWKINLTTNAITLHSDGLPLGKTSHSMIYIPHKYVFIIGGSSNNNVYYYNEDTTLFEQWAALNSAHAGSACAFINDALLYVFSNGSCERTNLRTQPYWEQVVPRVENEMLRMQQRLFGCCWDAKDEKVLLFGGRNVDNEERRECTGVIAYDWKGNMFVETKVKFMECELKEKTFLPFNDKYSYVLPKIKGKNVKLVCYNNIAKEFKEIAFIEDEDTAQQQRKAKITLTTTMKHHTNNIKSNINYKKYNFDMPTLNTKFLNTCSGFPKTKVNKTYTNTPFGNTATGDDNTNNIFDQLKE